MSLPHNTVSVDSPNIPLTRQDAPHDKLYGQFTSCSQQELDPRIGPVKLKDMFLPNFSVRTFEGSTKHDAVFYDHHGTGIHMIGSCIFFRGKVKTYVPGEHHHVVSFQGSQNFKFDPNNELRHRCAADTDLSFVHLSVLPEFFNSLLPDDEAWAEDLRNKIHRRERIIGRRFVPISLAQEQALRNIFDAPLTGKLGYMMIETSIIQVLLLQLHMLYALGEVHREPSLAKRDLETVQEIREFLTRSFLDDHSIQCLAQRFGTNTNKMMSLFKKAFGKSIFEFITDLRMEHARKLLREKGLFVNEVSRNIGYKNPNHFSAAFKKRYGMNPSTVRN